MPRCIEEYVHRVGRTGRAGRLGIAVTLVCRRDWAMASPLINILTEANQVCDRTLTASLISTKSVLVFSGH